MNESRQRGLQVKSLWRHDWKRPYVGKSTRALSVNHACDSNKMHDRRNATLALTGRPLRGPIRSEETLKRKGRRFIDQDGVEPWQWIPGRKTISLRKRKKYKLLTEPKVITRNICRLYLEVGRRCWMANIAQPLARREIATGTCELERISGFLEARAWLERFCSDCLKILAEIPHQQSDQILFKSEWDGTAQSVT